MGLVIDIGLLVACVVLAFIAFAPTVVQHALRFLSDPLQRKTKADTHTIVIAIDALYHRAEQLTQEAENFAAGTSGEYKRAHVFAKLIKEFPDRAKRDIGQVIEAVL